MSSPTLIAVLDDNLAVCEAIKICLEVDGFHVRMWQSAEKFLADPELSHIGLVLLDWQLRDMDGLDVANRLMALPDRPVIVMMTGAEADDLRGKAAEIGVDLVLHKPLTGTFLSATIALLLGSEADQ